MRYGDEARRYNHDQTQAHRRTAAQNRALIDLLNSIKPVEDQLWGFTDVPPEGGPFEVNHPRTRQTWIIERDGSKKLKEIE